MIKSIGFIGFGEAAYLIASGIKQEFKNVEIYAFDANQHHSEIGQAIQKRSSELNVTLVKGSKELSANCSFIINATSAKIAYNVAKETLPYLSNKQFYLDINAASPMVMEDIANLFEGKSNFIDGAVVESIPKYKHRVPILVSGVKAKEFKRVIGDSLNLNTSYISDQPGNASAIKMIRSVFMKGFTMLLVETLSASEKYNIDNWIIESISKSIVSNSILDTINLLIPRSVPHAERRVSEMNEVIQTLDKLNVDTTISTATRDKLNLLVEMGIKEKFNSDIPTDYKAVIEKINYLKV